jgi:hypothetical protein
MVERERWSGLVSAEPEMGYEAIQPVALAAVG